MAENTYSNPTKFLDEAGLQALWNKIYEEFVSINAGIKNHTFTPKGTVSSTFTGKAKNHSHTFTGTEVTSSKNSGTDVTVNSITSAGSLPTYKSETVASINHTHPVSVTATGTISETEITPTGTVSSTFTGTAKGHNHTFVGSVATSSKNSGTGVTVNSITGAGSLPTYKSENVASVNHTHPVSVTATGTISEAEITPEGTVSSTFTGTTKGHSHTIGNHSTTSSGLSISYSEGVLSISTGHTHNINSIETNSTSITPEGTVGSTFTGTEFTHSHIFTGTAVSANTNAPNDTNKSITIGSITGVGTLPTYEAKTVAPNEHTHTVTATGTVNNASVTPEGTVGSTFTGEEHTHTHLLENDNK